MKRTIRLTESELRRMIYESIIDNTKKTGDVMVNNGTPRTFRISKENPRFELNKEIDEVVNEASNDWNGLEKNKTINVNGRELPEREYKRYMKAKRDNEEYKGLSFDDWKARVKQEAANKRAETKAKKGEEEKARLAKKADRKAAKESGMSYEKYMEQKNKKVDKAVAESIRRYIKRLY